MTRAWPWIPLILLGAYHGLNPGMGWLFALARGLQECKRSAVVGALLPIALGHALAIALSSVVLDAAQIVVPHHVLKLIVAVILFVLALDRLLRARHPKGGGMRVGWWELGWWSFLMASSHGAGVMVLPVLIAHSGKSTLHAMDHSHAAIVGTLPFSISAILVHTVALLAVSGALAIAFYETYSRSGLSLLRSSWFNFDLLWAAALLVAAVVTLLL